MKSTVAERPSAPRRAAADLGRSSASRALACVLCLLLGLVLLPAIAGCMDAAGGAAPTAASPARWLGEAAVDADQAAFARPSMEQALAVNGPGASPTSTTAGPTEPPPDRTAVLIYTGTFTLAVVTVSDAVARVETLSREAGGFFVRRDDRSITIRVPARRFHDVVQQIEALGDVLHRNVSVEDVTAEFTDLATRLKSARAVRDRLKDLLTKATKVQDSLAIERELARIEAEIDRLETRYEYLRSRAAYSTITVTFEPRHSDVAQRPFRLPVVWLDHLGLGRLLDLQ